jgi:hypothetical protein
MKKDLGAAIKPIQLNKTEIEKPFVCELSSKQVKTTAFEIQKLLIFLKSNAVYNILVETEKLISSLRCFDQRKSSGSNNEYLQITECMNFKVIKRLIFEEVSFKKGLEVFISQIERRWLDEKGKSNETIYSPKV